jgi:hypothetical protein
MTFVTTICYDFGPGKLIFDNKDINVIDVYYKKKSTYITEYLSISNNTSSDKTKARYKKYIFAVTSPFFHEILTGL